MHGGSPYTSIIEGISPALWRQGLRILQGHRLASDDLGHVRILLSYLRPRHKAHILDVGCGFGEVARIMLGLRPDLRFTLLNISATQLRYAPRYVSVCGDMHALPFDADSFDYAMYLYSLTHGDPLIALSEAHRCASHLFIYDFERVYGEDAHLYASLHAHAWTRKEQDAQLHASGWRIVERHYPPTDDSILRGACTHEQYAQLFASLTMSIMRAVRA